MAQAGYMATANDTVTTGGQGATVESINVGTGAASAVVTVYNGTATTDPVVFTGNAAAVASWQFGDDGFYLPKGMFVKLTGGNALVTVTYEGN